jgi:tRNA threonylcarbamoyl adenosine modification protein (Sua5/YciO/YrdC/YwlC family)
LAARRITWIVIKEGAVSQFFQIHPENPQVRLIKQAADIIRAGGVVVFPTDSAYALGCRLGDKSALERVRAIRKLDEKHNFTLMCSDLSELGTYAKVDNSAFRLLKAHIPGPYTFILRATPEVPKRLHHPKRKSVGLRVPANQICLDLMAELGEPLMSVSLILPGEDLPMTDPYDIRETIGNLIDLVIDGGYCGSEATSIVDLVDDVPVVIRRGLGDVSQFEDSL